MFLYYMVHRWYFMLLIPEKSMQIRVLLILDLMCHVVYVCVNQNAFPVDAKYPFGLFRL
jgi:hypothetical protein